MYIMSCYFLTLPCLLFYFFFFFNDTATTEIYTLSLHDALPISAACHCSSVPSDFSGRVDSLKNGSSMKDRKSTRLNSSHGYISYAVFCLKKKKKQNKEYRRRIVDCWDVLTGLVMHYMFAACCHW